MYIHATSACRCALHTYRGLLLPHLDILPLRLSEVIPDFLVAGRSKDSFDLTDCWWHVVACCIQKTQQILRCIPFAWNSKLCSSVSSITLVLFTRGTLTRFTLNIHLYHDTPGWEWNLGPFSTNQSLLVRMYNYEWSHRASCRLCRVSERI